MHIPNKEAIAILKKSFRSIVSLGIMELTDQNRIEAPTTRSMINPKGPT